MLDNPDSMLVGSYSYIDVRDVALAHVVALEKEEAAGQRIIVSDDATTWQETSAALRHSFLPVRY